MQFDTLFLGCLFIFWNYNSLYQKVVFFYYFSISMTIYEKYNKTNGLYVNL